MRKAFAVEFDLPDSATPEEIKLIEDALWRVDRYVPGGATVTKVAPFQSWVSEPSPTPDEQSDQPVLSGMPVRVTTAAIPAEPPASPEFKEGLKELADAGFSSTVPFGDSASTATKFPPSSAQNAPDEPHFLFPKGRQPEASPEQRPVERAGMPNLVINRDVLRVLSQGAFSQDVSDWFKAILSVMPTDQGEVQISASFQR